MCTGRPIGARLDERSDKGAGPRRARGLDRPGDGLLLSSYYESGRFAWSVQRHSGYSAQVTVRPEWGSPEMRGPGAFRGRSGTRGARGAKRAQGLRNGLMGRSAPQSIASLQHSADVNISIFVLGNVASPQLTDAFFQGKRRFGPSKPKNFSGLAGRTATGPKSGGKVGVGVKVEAV